MAAPVLVAEDYGLSLIRRKRAPESQMDSEHVEDIGRDFWSPDLVRVTGAGQYVKFQALIGRQVLKGLGLSFPIAEVPCSHQFLGSLSVPGADFYELRRMPVRRCAE